jgi:mannose-6-phosphate isomerase-like protein (cupin superfamily)
MRATRRAVEKRKAARLAVVTALKGPVAFMHRADVGKLVSRGSKRGGRRLKPDYAIGEDGVDTVKVLMATDSVISFEAFRPKGAIDTAHQHPDHHSVVYQKQGRVRMWIGDRTFIVEAGDSYIHPMGVVHRHEALEDSVRIETKIYPAGGAVASWNRLVGGGAKLR